MSVLNNGLFLVLLISLVFPMDLPTTTVYVGAVQGSSKPSPVPMIPDLTLGITTLNIRDFVCATERGCRITSGYKDMELRGVSFKAREAMVSLNLVPATFATPMLVYYVDDQNSVIDSFLGVAPRADFFRYLAAQNQTAMKIQMDLDNNVTITSDAFIPNHFLYFDLANFVELKFAGPTSISKSYQKFCVTNSFELFQDKEVYLAVEEDNLRAWKSYFISRQNGTSSLRQTRASHRMGLFLDSVLGSPKGLAASIPVPRSQLISDSTTTLPPDVTFELRDEHEHLIAEVGLTAKQILNSTTGDFRLAAFSKEYDDYAKCNFYTGKGFLRDHNVTFYFVKEAGKDFRSYWTLKEFDGSHPVLEVPKSHPFFSWDLLFFTGLYMVVAYLIWQYVLKAQPGDALDPTYTNMAFEMTPNAFGESNSVQR